MSIPTPFRLQGFIFFLLLSMPAAAQMATNRLLASHAQEVFVHARKQFDAHRDSATNAIQLGRATYDFAEFATNMDQRADVARAGVEACRHLLALDPKSAPGHYYLGMDYGELAEAEAPSLAAYHLIREIEREFKSAADLNERLDYAGPIRCLGLLYRDAPGWPISIGSKHKAREYLERAAALAPDYPENQMNLLESYVRWHEEDEAEKTWRKLAALWPVAKTNLTGIAWEADWADWTYRRQVAREAFEKTFRRFPAP